MQLAAMQGAVISKETTSGHWCSHSASDLVSLKPGHCFTRKFFVQVGLTELLLSS